MAYTPQTWVNGSGGGTPLSATRMNYMEAGIAAASGGSVQVVAARQATRARAVAAALLAETLPGVTIATPQSGATAISGGVDVASYGSGVVNPLFRYAGGTIAQAGGSFPDDTAVRATGLDSTFGGLTFATEFAYTGASFEFLSKFRVTGSRYRVWVDGVIASTVNGPAGSPDGAIYRYLVTLPDARARTIRLDFSADNYFSGVARASTASVSYPTSHVKGPRCIVFGDSFIEGTGATDPYNAIPARIGLHTGWIDTWASGSGGTGYLATPVSPAGRKTFRGRSATDLVATAPDIVVLCGGYNDSASTGAAVGTEAGLLFDALATGIPAAEVIIVGPWGRTVAQATTGDLQRRDAIQAQAVSHGFYFVDPVGEGWITGTGNSSSPAGDGNADVYIGSDNAHPTDAGHAWIASRIVGHMRALGALG